MKPKYLKPQLEVYSYMPELGVKVSVGNDVNYDERKDDYVLIQGGDRSIMRSSDVYTEYTDESGQYETGLWDF